MASPEKGEHLPTSAIEQDGNTVVMTEAANGELAKSNHGGKEKEKTKNEKPQANLGNYFRVLAYGTRLDFCLMLVSCLTSIGAGVAMPLMNIVFGSLVGDFTNYFLPNTTVTKQQFQSSVNKNALYIVYLFIGKFVLSYLSMFTIRISGLRISAALRLAYLRATFAQPVSRIDTVSPGKVSTRITTSANTIQLSVSQSFAMLFQSLAFTVGLYVVSFVKSWLLTFVASAALPFILIVYGGLVPPFIKLHKVTEAYHEDASALAFEIFSSIRVVVAFGAQTKLESQHAALLDKAAKNEKKAAPLMGLMMSPSMLSMYGMFGLTFWFGIRQYSRGHIDDVGDIIVVLFSVMMAVMNIGRLVGPIIAIAKAATAATELFATIDAERPHIAGLKDPDVSADADIQFDDVSFSYPSRPNVQILDNLNVKFEAGKTTAIVGPSGSGKSTVVALLQRWYDLLGTTANVTTKDKTEDSKYTQEAEEQEKGQGKGESTVSANSGPEKVEVSEPHTCTGAVNIGGVNLRNVDLKWWRAQIGLVQQEPFLFNDTLFNNVAFGLCGTPLNDASDAEKMALVEEACREAYAEEFISKLPEGYQTMVGESGIKLSGGQRQRIAIARSIIKKPSILILDEATSAIDVRTERIVQEALDRVSKNRTTIVIAHRLSTIKKADKIVVLRNGRLVEEGTHEELVDIEDGVYHGLVKSQKLALEAEEEAGDEPEIHKTKTRESEQSTEHTGEQHLVAEDPEYKNRGLLNSFGRLIVEQRRHKILYTLAILGILGAGAVYPLQAWIFSNVIQVFTYTGEKFVKDGNFWSGMFGVEAAGVGLSYFVLGLCAHLISVAITRHYRQEYLCHIIRKRIPFFDAEGHSPGSLTSSISSDTTQLQQLMSTEMSLAMIAVVNLIGSIIIAFVYGWKLSLVGLFCALPPILLAGYFRISIEMKFEQMTATVFKESSQFATEAVGAFRTVLSLTMEDMIGDRYQSLLRAQVKEAYGKAKYGTVIFAASDSVDLACMALSFWYGGTLLASREYDLMDFFVIYMAVIQGALAAGQWFSLAPNMSQATAAANRILSMRPTSSSKATTYRPIPESESLGGGVEFRNVFFKYPTREAPVLSNLNLKILPGQFVGLVGASGSGKSTTISLLERFYDATSGQVLYNGEDITTLDPEEYRKRLSLVSQEPTLYEGTIRDNVALSKDGATDEEIELACKDAQIHEFIVSLPDGYNTRLGPKGMSLSGGQKQRLSLARALLRKPDLLLLDEATSSLDSESEKLVQTAIEHTATQKGRTVIAIAHRLATIQKADVIFVLGSGKVLEKGDHHALLRKRGIYYQMCQAQALDR
ncbi:P-loop containing nucleoside triphosphate hydrolase protein [Westerdykella ornata]|uniref:P-loop containing nucleoside triphosphate hydrolase protein n=1 Tax=Westerdykella ornata TaxID=318751 RepID=A0A6A6JSJ0_WESOR|nr:P-loop containing nucleoside triphosphate hydrolase protein [Westerdykella ornata]KAF2279224.1 P-loop containing nucleoside triphosphate hydrolase protein [Westerdykella ornata]